MHSEAKALSAVHMGVWAALFLFKTASLVNVLVESRLTHVSVDVLTFQIIPGWTMNDFRVLRDCPWRREAALCHQNQSLASHCRSRVGME